MRLRGKWASERTRDVFWPSTTDVTRSPAQHTDNAKPSRHKYRLGSDRSMAWDPPYCLPRGEQLNVIQDLRSNHTHVVREQHQLGFMV